MAHTIKYVLLIFGIACVTTCLSSSQCQSVHPRGIYFSVASKKNNTGHWNALVNLKHGNNLQINENKETGSWEVDVKQTSEKCGHYEAVDVTLSISAPPPRAGPGYELVPDLGYYKMHITPKTWPEARQICSDEGAHLAIVNSDKELKALQGLISPHPKIQDGWENNYGFVGFHDLYLEGQYLTIFGDPLESTGYSKFAKGEPNGVGSNCGCIHRTNDLLYDVQCHATLAFYCEQELL